LVGDAAMRQDFLGGPSISDLRNQGGAVADCFVCRAFLTTGATSPQPASATAASALLSMVTISSRSLSSLPRAPPHRRHTIESPNQLNCPAGLVVLCADLRVGGSICAAGSNDLEREHYCALILVPQSREFRYFLSRNRCAHRSSLLFFLRPTIMPPSCHTGNTPLQSLVGGMRDRV